jgi:glyoxylase-like metal-dependent hydrolase (beta-lactamase superfamily II)
MAVDIPFRREVAFEYGRLEPVAPGVRRIVARNPGPFTFKGTGTYVVGDGEVAVIDPGPELEEHVAALLASLADEQVTHILVTHTHRDHSPAAACIKAVTGGLLVGEGPHRPARALQVGEHQRLEASADLAFLPDVSVSDGQIVHGSGWTLEAIATPGHTLNHMAYALREAGVLFSGDHVMAWSTPVVAPPDGAMRDYMASLRKIGRRPETTYLPGHGGPVRDAPRFVQHYVRHREAREASILHRLAKGSADIAAIVRAVYIGLDPRLSGAAGLSVLAHLEDLVARGVVLTDGVPSLTGTYRLARP